MCTCRCSLSQIEKQSRAIYHCPQLLLLAIFIIFFSLTTVHLRPVISTLCTCLVNFCPLGCKSVLFFSLDCLHPDISNNVLNALLDSFPRPVPTATSGDGSEGEGKGAAGNHQASKTGRTTPIPMDCINSLVAQSKLR